MTTSTWGAESGPFAWLTGESCPGSKHWPSLGGKESPLGGGPAEPHPKPLAPGLAYLGLAYLPPWGTGSAGRPGAPGCGGSGTCWLFRRATEGQGERSRKGLSGRSRTHSLFPPLPGRCLPLNLSPPLPRSVRPAQTSISPSPGSCFPGAFLTGAAVG